VLALFTPAASTETENNFLAFGMTVYVRFVRITTLIWMR
jgi:hypothetical protein